MFDSIWKLLVFVGGVLLVVGLAPWGTGPLAGGAEPPVISPFGQAPSVREDAVPGYVEMSDGTIHPGQVYLTRDARLKIFDEKLNRQREVPLRVIGQIECKVKREWMEQEWKFKEAASDEKMFTGRTYPAREYVHTITLRDERQITGPLSGIVYVQPYAYTASEPGAYRTRPKAERYLLQKRSKGELGKKLDSLVYVKRITLGDEALAEGRRKAAQRRREEGDRD
ncbi:MAG: hypothetical protein A2V70_10450 [Planctomycetes bacterium RBG_13_63_9]|nr:MAG: hypothetical protein A2V70_10450 [Planctomycetes bacterium RBG_13_63_9]